MTGATGTNDPAARLTGLVRALRGHGIPIGPAETVDAAAVAGALGFADRERLREGLAAAVLRSSTQRTVFDPVFDLFFPLGVGRPEAAREQAAAPDVEELRARLAEALASGDRTALARLAGEAVDALGRYGSAPGSDGFSAHQALGRLQPETLLARVLAGLGRDSAGTGSAGAAFTDRLEADEVRRRIREFRARVGTEARRRVAELRGTERIAARAVAPTVDQLDFLTAGREQLAELRRAVQPLARKLATRLAARRRRAARGQLDLRRTLRRSLSTGGVPLRPAYRQRRPGKPDLVLLCDVSGSVAGFSDFTVLLVRAISEQFGRVRVFAFVNRTAEVTHLLTGPSAAPAGAARRILTEAKVAGYHGSSDYGAALRQFADEHLTAVGPRTAVLVLGDARTNGFDPDTDALRRIAAAARRVHWLNPEPPSQWGSGDSAALAYAQVVPMHPCRNARRLTALASRLLPV
ncbi:VWA domain-containing protein [Kitasatospora terrestris]|uniref:VWA domain-containing protein n=1 Tax=Kitasatospora terrestris TaxID=258051 RepID=A0ABP9EHG1_9ACTN